MRTANQQQSNKKFWITSIGASVQGEPEVLLNALVPIFTYMGKSASVHDDNFTFHVVQRIVESVVSAVQVQGKHNVTLRKLLNVFVL